MNAPPTFHRCFLIRIGSMGNIGRFLSDDPLKLQRGDVVICRSSRGLEQGTILSQTSLPQHLALNIAADHSPTDDAQAETAASLTTAELLDGRLLRRSTSEDHLLWQQLTQLGADAHEECRSWLSEHAVAATLLDVEPLMDGKTLIFHFMSEAPPEVQPHLDHLVKIYERKVRESKFAQLLNEGCGPGCGTDAKPRGCGTSSGCAVCSVAKQCKSSA